MATLNCQQCGYANEAERIYCHNCGTKLDRSLLPQESKPKEDLKDVQRRVKKVVSPARGLFSGWFRSLFNSLVWAALAAAVIQIARPPADVPPMPTADESMDFATLLQQVEEAQAKPAPQSISISEKAADGYLKYWVKPKKQEGLYASDVKFERAYVQFGEGVCRIYSQHAIFGYSLYAGTAYKVSIKGTGIEATNIGGSLGRLPLAAVVMEQADFVFPKLWAALTHEKKVLDRLQSIEIHKGQFVVLTKPAVAPR